MFIGAYYDQDRDGTPSLSPDFAVEVNASVERGGILE
jgi:hypothetical protein